jgi:radical SAM superfamily enzyme YgiQ (UPF0313 family)
MPIGLCYVASALESRGHYVKVVDLMFEPDWGTRIAKALAEEQPEIVGVSIRNIDNADWYDSLYYLKRIKDEVVPAIRRNSKALIIIGGPAVNISPLAMVEEIGADCAVYGDGEAASCRLVESWQANDGPPDLPGIVWHSRFKEALRPDAPQPARVLDLAGNTRARIYKWVDIKPYLRRGAAYSIQTKRGCAFDCSFCVYGQIEGRHYRERNAEDIADEITEVNRETGAWQFEFTDSVFNHPAGHAEALCRAIARRRLNVSLTSSGVNPLFLTAELLELMEQAGFEDYSLAPDSASNRVLALLGKGYTSSAVLERAACLAKASRLPVLWWFSFGLPGEDRESVQETVDFISKHVRARDLALCSVGMRIFPGTRLAEIARNEGQIAPNPNLLEPCFYEPPGISLREIHERLQLAAAHWPKIMLSSETRAFPLAMRTGILIKRALRHHYPMWRPVIWFRALQIKLHGVSRAGSRFVQVPPPR